MDGSNLDFIVLPIVILVVLFIGVAAPFIAARDSGSRRPSRPPGCDAVRHQANAQQPGRSR